VPNLIAQPKLGRASALLPDCREIGSNPGTQALVAVNFRITRHPTRNGRRMLIELPYFRDRFGGGDDHQIFTFTNIGSSSIQILSVKIPDRIVMEARDWSLRRCLLWLI